MPVRQLVGGRQACSIFKTIFIETKVAEMKLLGFNQILRQ